MLPEVAARVDEATFRRCRHVVEENVRVEASVAALEAGDLAEVGRLWAASHASLRDDYEVVSPELDALVEIAAATPGVVAARMTGAGFGGCTVNLVERGGKRPFATRSWHEYPGRTGLLPRFYAGRRRGRRGVCARGLIESRCAGSRPRGQAFAAPKSSGRVLVLALEGGSGAGDGIRTRDILLGKQTLCQLSYSRSEQSPV